MTMANDLDNSALSMLVKKYTSYHMTHQEADAAASLNPTKQDTERPLATSSTACADSESRLAAADASSGPQGRGEKPRGPTEDPWGFEELPEVQEFPVSLPPWEEIAQEITNMWPGAQQKFFRVQYWKWTREILHPRIQAIGESFWSQWELAWSSDWFDAMANVQNATYPVGEHCPPERAAYARTLGSFGGQPSGYRLPRFPRILAIYSTLTIFPILNPGLRIETEQVRDTQPRRMWEVLWVDGPGALEPGQYIPQEGWVFGYNQEVTFRWRREAEKNFPRQRRPWF